MVYAQNVIYVGGLGLYDISVASGNAGEWMTKVRHADNHMGRLMPIESSERAQ